MIRKYLRWLYAPIMKMIRNRKSHDRILNDTLRLDELGRQLSESQHRVFYLGITQHSNLGDMGQHYCIKKWISKNYPASELIMFEVTTVIDRRFDFFKKLKAIFRPQDVIVFQSGYTTTDLGGYHDEMHRMVIENMPDAHILMMPQTIFFRKEKNRERTAKSYDMAQHMLFLARDMVSFEAAKRMFPHVTVKVFPDIVTTLIGSFDFNHERKGICLCRRNDSEKYYPEADIVALKDDLNKIEPVTVTDTTINENFMQIRNNLQSFIEREIERFSYFKVTITDRYHGTIFSLAAGTPVVIIKTTDHKVVTGADWFKGIYDDYVFVAKDLEDAKALAKNIISEQRTNKLEPYFNDNYYSKLKDYFQNV